LTTLKKWKKTVFYQEQLVTPPATHLVDASIKSRRRGPGRILDIKFRK
jgi:hypothetical protein